ncbi:MAG: SOS cell division inhibitor [Marinobacter sp.]|nr:SOS cell division inhibitor [Marinobacter sp.]
MAEVLAQLDALLAELQSALTDQAWDALAAGNDRVRPLLEGMLAEFEAGRLSEAAVRDRLEAFQAFCDQAQGQAETARDSARQALEGMQKNRKAARSYQDVSDRRSR